MVRMGFRDHVVAWRQSSFALSARGRAIEPFFTTKVKGMHAGLGLSVAHGIAAQSGGLLRIESAIDKGTIVELWLPQSDLHSVLAAHNAGTTSAGSGVNVQ
jgi:light-regulated signal transduction histidine kinase (bacteriophytochrome)